MKNPILIMGILMMGLFLYDLQDRGKLPFYRRALNVTSCKAVLVKLQKRIPNHWDASCEQEEKNLVVKIPIDHSPNDKKQLKARLYRELANHMIYVAKNSPEETLERVFITRFELNHPELTIHALTQGKMLIKLKTLHTPEHIREHLQQSVQVRESFK